MRPSTRKARPPNMRFSVSPGSLSTTPRIRSASSSSYAMPRSITHSAPPCRVDLRHHVPEGHPPRAPSDDLVQPADRGAFPGVTKRLQLVVPRLAEELVDLDL